MKIVFFIPPLPANKRHKKVLPLGVLYLSSFLKKKLPDIELDIVDAHIEDLNLSQALHCLLAKKPDLIGFSYWTLQADFSHKLAEEIRKADNKIILVGGGVHASLDWKVSANYFDFLIPFEGEFSFLSLVEALIKGNQDVLLIRGLVLKREGKLINTGFREFIDNLDILPFPDWDLVNIHRYDTPLHVAGGTRVPVIGSRGCPFNCIFCASPYIWKRRVRFRSPVNVAQEIALVKDKYSIDRVHFWDDNIMLNRDYFKGLCEEIIKEKLDIKWVGLTRSQDIINNRDLLGLAKESGCVGIEIGIESANSLTYKIVKKGEAEDLMREASYLQEKEGLSPLYTFMCFNPGENISTYYSLKSFVESISPYSGNYRAFNTYPFPVYVGQFATPHLKTEFYRSKDSFGLDLSSSYAEKYHHVINFLPFSLLYDIPKKRFKLSLDDRFVCLQVYKGSLWNEILPSSSLPERLAKEKQYLDFLDCFWKLINSRDSFQEIARKTSYKMRLPYKLCLQYGALTVVVLSQMGRISSCSWNGHVSQSFIRLPKRFNRLRKYLLFKFLGIFFLQRKRRKSNL